MKKCIIIANGKPPSIGVMKFLQKENYSTIICADGGANSAFKLGVVPDYIIGDLDSITDKTKKYFNKKSKIVKIKRQNDTDVEKCLKFAIKKKIGEAVLVGVTGDRLDHSFCNLGIVLKFFNKIKMKIIAEKSLLTAHTGAAEFKTIKDEIFSIYGFNKKTKITSTGLKYPLENKALPFGEKESTSNVATGNRMKLKINGGKVFVIRDFKTVSGNGHF
ncbi:MAG TPA: thiamine diphosphokinase [Ignavibacteriaceae bacterium]|nr:thiamine diphosphokinase [Ignavibacteriaceae bacterium]